MKKFSIVVGALVLSLPLSAYAQTDVIASAGKASITQADMTALLKSLPPQTRAQLTADPTKLDQVVRSRLAVDAVAADASAKGWDKQPSVQTMIAEARREVVMRSYLASVSTPPAGYPSDAEIQAAYDQNKAAMAVPRALRLAQIYVAVAPNSDAATIDKARRRATDLAHQARAPGADFAALAKANSQDQFSASKGGEMGFVQENMLLPEVRKAADAMKVGTVSDVIQTTAGFHIIKLTDTRPAGVRSLADVKEQIRAQLRQQRAAANAQAYVAKIGANTVAINEAALGKAVSAAQ